VPTRAQSPKHRAAVAEIHEQRPDSSRSPVSAVSDGGFERVATKAGLFGIRHTVLWDRCMIHLSVVCCGRAVPCCGECWSTIARQLPSASTKDTAKSALATAPSPDVMLLADRGFANHDLMDWLRLSSWHYAIRLPCDAVAGGKPLSDNDRGTVSPFRRSLPHSQCGVVGRWLTVAI